MPEGSQIEEKLKDPISKKTSVQISHETRLKLAKLGMLSQTYDSLIVELIEHVWVCPKFWEDRI